MKKKDLIIVMIFILFLILPSILYWFLKDKMDNANYENRNLYLKPELTFKGLTNFPRNYENYFNDHLPFKNEIRKLRAKLLYNVLNLSSSPSVIVGEDGWLFYNSEQSNDGTSISDYQKKYQYSSDEKDSIKTKIVNFESKLNAQGANLYVLIAPNKENVYSDKLDSIISRSDNEYSKTEDLILYLKENSNLKIVYPKNQLLSSRNFCDTYLKYDTHWNDYGAYIGAIEFIKEYDKGFKDLEINVSKEKKSGDLAIMNMTSQLQNDEPKINGFYDDISYWCDDENSIKYCYSSNPVYDEKIIVVGDSFRTAMIPYISKMYKNSIFVHRNQYSDSLIVNNDVDIVLYEIVERYSYLLDEIG